MLNKKTTEQGSSSKSK